MHPKETLTFQLPSICLNPLTRVKGFFSVYSCLLAYTDLSVFVYFFIDLVLMLCIQKVMFNKVHGTNVQNRKKQELSFYWASLPT